ncbi:aspartyl/glutamyl-tRNA amidotransferase subunit B [Gonapodya prolifera JEL478]|uniref:Glutamyl-tRNA(Gln) amidotransferase subunit B, mitochondrial n=1 Tax=Gonapodya prolifera (strain JEL478) TaxID=1344416 RepID=A0A139AWJ8_GONPJ|nr:aspartyl/glutamyl-tRNA amidotransferase subunit B [Gonapodya prolifera JEL478]|eukprot:KXS21116.1 aspartyl/glutamyl-tRNA amidotransferase subunit B [Gonapodya prolifera JEL478]
MLYRFKERLLHIQSFALCAAPSAVNGASGRHYYVTERSPLKVSFFDGEPANHWNGMETGWRATIGLELHCQIRSGQKLFSGAPFSAHAEVNENVTPFDAAFPGTLPRLNPHCLAQALRASLALGCAISAKSAFDRKHYFYNDLPQGYQITQHFAPLAVNGKLILGDADGLKDGSRTVSIQQVQIEQDTGKSLEGDTENDVLVDLNRAGAGLIEIVTGPDMRSSTEATSFVRKMFLLLDHIGVLAEGGFEDGSLRCDVNVSVGRAEEEGSTLGTRCEVKNLNSIKSVGKAIEHEISRQISEIERGGSIVPETRGFDPFTETTVPQRNKESAREYRYIPDPDLPPVLLSEHFIARCRASLPELPDDLRLRLTQPPYSLSPYIASLLVNEPGSTDVFERLTKMLSGDAETSANWIVGPVFSHLRSDPTTKSLREKSFGVDMLAEVIKLVKDESISNLSGKYLLQRLLDKPLSNSQSVQDVARELALMQESTGDELDLLCDELFRSNQDKIDLIVNKQRHSLIGFFVGTIQQRTNRKYNPKVVDALVRKRLGVE